MTYARAVWVGSILLCFMVAAGCSCGGETEGSSFDGATTTGSSGTTSSGTTSSGTTSSGTTSTSATSSGTAGGGQGGSGPMPCGTAADCDDGLFCTGLEACVNGLCAAGVAPTCADNVACTGDFCDPATDSCAHVESDAACSNGQFCDGIETCDAVNGAPGTGCLPGTAITCGDGIACTTDACDENLDQCIHVAVNAACANGSFCDGAEVCNPVLGCVAGPPPNCDDARSCTSDSCNDAQGGCLNTPVNAACNDGQFCNGTEICSGSGPAPTGCIPGVPVNCPADNIACTAEACSNAAQGCTSTPIAGSCPAGQVCNPQQGCVQPQVCSTNAQCQDGNLCNGVETCVGGFCQPGQALTCNDQIGCTIDSCNPATGACVYAPNNAACNDGFACNGVETCTPQGCVNSPPPNCEDNIMCTVDVCQEPSGTCSHYADDILCDDGVLCNGAEVCNAQSGCQVGSGAPPCPGDGIACTSEVCDLMSDTCVSVPNNTLCPCGQTCDVQAGGCGSFCLIKECQGHVYACGDCLDNDGDCAIDDADTQCLGPCDNTEDSFYGGIPGQNNSPCKSDCYFDQDTGAGNDDCYWSHKCDPYEVPPNYPPEGSQCSYNPNANIPGYNGTCMTAYNTQSAECLNYCGPLTPNGCDCFGCCDIPGAPTTVWLGSENPSGTGSCNLMNVSNPNMCKPCTQVQACLNTCAHCEICIGKPTLPPDCLVQECPNGAQPCGQPGQSPCDEGYTCITGCCQQNPTLTSIDPSL